jgi:hypothetical protein
LIIDEFTNKLIFVLFGILEKVGAGVYSKSKKDYYSINGEEARKLLGIGLGAGSD